MQYYNYMDFTLLALYLASYALRFVAQLRVVNAERYFNITADDLKVHMNFTRQQELVTKMQDPRNYEFAYFLKACAYLSTKSYYEQIGSIAEYISVNNSILANCNWWGDHCVLCSESKKIRRY